MIELTIKSLGNRSFDYNNNWPFGAGPPSLCVARLWHNWQRVSHQETTKYYEYIIHMGYICLSAHIHTYVRTYTSVCCFWSVGHHFYDILHLRIALLCVCLLLCVCSSFFCVYTCVCACFLCAHTHTLLYVENVEKNAKYVRLNKNRNASNNNNDSNSNRWVIAAEKKTTNHNNSKKTNKIINSKRRKSPQLLLLHSHFFFFIE